MADDDHLNVDLDVGSNELEPSLRRAFDVMLIGLQRAEGIQQAMAKSADEARRFADEVRSLSKAVEATPAGSDTKREAVAALAERRTQQEAHNEAVKAEIGLQRDLNLARGAADRTRMGNALPDGRTVGQAHNAENALRDAITGINTTTDQLTARLAAATGKAMERLLTSTTQAIENSYALAQQRQASRAAQLAVPGYTEARIANDRVAAELAVERAQQGGTLAERRGRAARVAQLEAQRAEAERRETDYQRLREGYRAGEIRQGLREDARNADPATAVREANRDRTFQRQNGVDYATYVRDTQGLSREERVAYLAEARARTEAGIRELNEAYALNRRFDEAGNKAWSDTVAAAKAENARRDKQIAEAYRDNRTYDRDTRAAAKAENERFDRAVKQREAAEAARRNPDTALRMVAKDQSFLNRTGMERSAFEEQIVRENLSLAQQQALLRSLMAERRATTVAGRRAPKSDEELEGDARENFRARGKSFDLNGGADQFAFQAKLAANYAIFGAITGTITASVAAIREFDDTLARFQAITGSANSEMGAFRQGLLDIAKDSRFSVTELAQVSIQLGQTGLSATDALKALRPVADLAAASGSTLVQAVEAVTGVLGAYGMAAGRAAEVSDILVGALNATKLTMEQLQLGIQYAANIARDSGVSFSELTATIGAISQAGVKSGSTIGTGVRQLITEFTSPSEKLRAVLKELGVGLAEVDLRANGLSGVLKNLQDAGFTTADALRSLDLRAAAAFSAIAGQSELIEKLRTEMLLSSSAAAAAGKANESLAATLQRLQNTAFGLVDTAFKPMVEALKVATGGLADLVGGFDKLGPILPAIGAGLTGIVGALALLKVGSLAIGLLSGGLVGLPALAVGTAVAIGVLVANLVDLDTGMGRIEKRLDQLKGVQNELSSRRDAVTLTLADIDKQIDGLIARKDKLDQDPLQLQNAIIEAQKGFGDVGFRMEDTSKSADGLIRAFQRLRAEMRGQLPDLGLQQIVVTQEKLIALAEKQRLLKERDRSEVLHGVGDILAYDPSGQPIRGPVVNRPLDRFRALGGPFAEAMDVVDDPSRIDPKNALGSTQVLTAQLLRAQEGFLAQRLAEQTKPVAQQDPRRIEELNERYKLATEAVKRFAETTTLAVQRQASETELERRTDEQRILALRADPRVTAVSNEADRIEAARASDQTAVIGARGLDGRTRIQQLMAALGVTGDAARGQLGQLDALRDDMLAGGQSKADVEAALGEIRGRLDTIAKNATKELRELIESLKPEAALVGQAERRANDAQLATLAKQAQNSVDQTDLASLTARMRTLIEANATIGREILTFGRTPEQMAADAGLREQLAQLDTETQAKLDRLQEDFVQRRKRIEDAVLKLGAEADKAREAELRAQASKLEKIAREAQTTPDKARDLVEQINRLLDEAAEIAKRRNATETAREIATAPTGPIPDNRAAPAGSVAAQVIAATRGAGRGDMVHYLLGLGQLESGMDPNARNKSGAAGLYQFMPGTWPSYGKGNILDVDNQVAAAIRFTDDNRRTFKDRLGREATDAELFVLHNQGAAGGTRLLRNPNGRAADYVSTDAIENNLPERLRGQGLSATIGAGEFTRLLKEMYATASRASETLTTTAKAVLGDRERAQNQKVDEDTAADKRRAGAIVQQKDDQALLTSLKLADRTTTAEIAAAMMRIQKANGVATVGEASSGAIAAYGRLNANALKEDGLDLNARSRTPEQKAEAQATITERFRQLAEREAIAAADAAGKVSTRVADQEIGRAEERLKALRLDKNENKASQQEIDALDQQLVRMKERRALEGESQSIREQIAVLEKALADAAAAGLGPAEKQVLINEKLLELKRRQGLADGQVRLKRDLDATAPSMGNAVSGGIIDFEKSRGIRNWDGTLVEETQQARKLITAELAVIGGAFDTLWTNLFTGSMRAGDALKRFATDILGGLMSQISKSLTNDIFKGLFGTREGDGTGGGLVGSLIDGVSSLFSGSPISSKANGGPIRMAGGGGVPFGDAALAQRDSQLVQAMPGEYLLRKSAVDAIGRDTLDQVNALGATMVSRAPRVDARQKFAGNSAQANVYVVDRDQVPQPGPEDFVYAIGQNIQRGGSIKTLIKRVQAGG